MQFLNKQSTLRIDGQLENCQQGMALGEISSEMSFHNILGVRSYVHWYLLARQ